MRIDKIPIGQNPPDDINVIIEIPVGGQMEDDAGHDEKIIAVPSERLTARYTHIRSYRDLPEITVRQIEHFFLHYKDLEPNKWVKLASVEEAPFAKKIIVESVERAKGHGNS
jgi:inorganic pyrophosphatase